MNPVDDLKLILDVVSKASDGALSFAMWWVVLDALKAVVCAGGFFGVAFYIARGAIRELKSVNFIRSLRDVAVPGRIGLTVTPEEEYMIKKAVVEQARMDAEEAKEWQARRMAESRSTTFVGVRGGNDEQRSV